MKEEWGGVALVKLNILLLCSKDRKLSEFIFFLPHRSPCMDLDP